MHSPLFHDLHTIVNDADPRGLGELSTGALEAHTAAPAAWKLKSWTLMDDKSVRFVAAACSRKARSYANPTNKLSVRTQNK